MDLIREVLATTGPLELVREFAAFALVLMALLSLVIVAWGASA